MKNNANDGIYHYGHRANTLKSIVYRLVWVRATARICVRGIPEILTSVKSHIVVVTVVGGGVVYQHLGQHGVYG